MERNKGFSLIVTIVVIVLLASLGIVGLSLLSTESQSSVDAMLSTKAFFIAEGGLQYYMEQLANTDPEASWVFDANIPATPANEPLGIGTFTITVPAEDPSGEPTDERSNNEIDVWSEAHVTGADGETIVRVVYSRVSRLSGPGNVPEAFYYASYVENHIIFGNDTDGLSDITGDVAAKMNVSIGSGWTHNGNSYPNTELDFPWADFDKYEEWVEDTYGAGHVTSGNKTFTVGGSPYSGVYFVGGNVTIDANATINGGIVTRGGVNMNNADGATINASSGLPALISEQAINIQNSSDVALTGTGLIYAEQGVSIRNAIDSSFSGTFVVDNNFQISGGSTSNISIIYNSDIVVNPPPFFKAGHPEPTLWKESYMGGY